MVVQWLRLCAYAEEAMDPLVAELRSTSCMAQPIKKKKIAYVNLMSS